MSLFFISGIYAAGQQFTNAGIVLNSGLIYTYLPGTVIPAATYTDSTGAFANTNPLVLSPYGRLQTGLWMEAGSNMKYVVTDADGNVLETRDNIPSIPSSDYYTSGVFDTTSIEATSTASNAPYPVLLSSIGVTGQTSPLFSTVLTYNPGTKVLELGSGGSIHAPTFVGAFSGNATTATSTANITGGVTGAIVVQTAPNTSGFIAPGDAGQALVSNGAGMLPSYSAILQPVTTYVNTNYTVGQMFTLPTKTIGVVVEVHTFQISNTQSSALVVLLNAINVPISTITVFNNNAGNGNDGGSGMPMTSTTYIPIDPAITHIQFSGVGNTPTFTLKAYTQLV